MKPSLVMILFAVTVAAATSPAAQQLLDRVVARVGDYAISNSDVEAAIGFGIVDTGPGAAPPLDQLIERRLILSELMRRPPAPPDPEAVEAELARLRASAGDRLSTLMTSTGVDLDRLRGVARDNLRIEAYLADRFPLVPAGDADAELYYRTHPEQFTRNGALLPLTQVIEEARRGAAEERRATRIAGWLATLRNRTDINVVE